MELSASHFNRLFGCVERKLGRYSNGFMRKAPAIFRPYNRDDRRRAKASGLSLPVGDPWLSGWKRRKSHVINYASGAGTLYQKRIKAYKSTGTDSDENVYLGTNVRDDFGDVRFTDDDGSTPLDYWMVSYTSGVSAIFWVEVADDLSSVNQTIYLYYDKSDATTTSNFDNTFIFGDPFDSPTLDTNRWTSVDGSPTYSINTVSHYLEVTDMAGTNWRTGKGFHSKTFTMPSTWMIEDAYGNANGFYEYEATSVASELNEGWHILHHTAWSSSDFGVSVTCVCDPVSTAQQYNRYAGVGGNVDWQGTLTDGSSYTDYWKMYKLAGTIYVIEAGTQRVAEANSETPDRFHLGISRYQTNAFGTQRFGAFIIRKYVSPEPSHGAWGGEEYMLPTVTDSGVGVDTVSSIEIPISDVGVGVDVATKEVVGVPIDVFDSGSGIDTPTVESQIPVADSGIGVDTPFIETQIPVTDSGLGTDIIQSIEVPVQDLGLGVDEIASIEIPVSDSGLGTDVPSIETSIPVSDSGIGVDTPIIESQVSVLDSGIGVDTIPSIGVLVSDTGLGVDVPSIQSQVQVTDLGSGVEVVSVEGHIVVVDLGVGVDVPSVLGQIPVSDLGVGVDVVKAETEKAVADSGIGVDSVWLVRKPIQRLLSPVRVIPPERILPPVR